MIYVESVIWGAVVGLGLITMGLSVKRLTAWLEPAIAEHRERCPRCLERAAVRRARRAGRVR